MINLSKSRSLEPHHKCMKFMMSDDRYARAGPENELNSNTQWKSKIQTCKIRILIVPTSKGKFKYELEYKFMQRTNSCKIEFLQNTNSWMIEFLHKRVIGHIVVQALRKEIIKSDHSRQSRQWVPRMMISIMPIPMTRIVQPQWQ